MTQRRRQRHKYFEAPFPHTLQGSRFPRVRSYTAIAELLIRAKAGNFNREHYRAGFAIRKTGFDAGHYELVSKRQRSLP